MKLIADLHTHTTLSGHAFSTLHENITMAKKNKMTVMASTDHGPAMRGASLAPYLFLNQFIVADWVEGVRVLKGAEVNIMDDKASFDLPDFILKKLEWVVASLHEMTLAPAGPKANLRALEAAMASGLVDLIAHPGNPAFPLDHSRLAGLAREMGLALELNNTSLRGLVRQGSKENIISLLRACKKEGTLISVGSDAHWMMDVGDLSLAQTLLEDLSFPADLVLNAQEDRLLSFVKSRQDKRQALAVRPQEKEASL